MTTDYMSRLGWGWGIMWRMIAWGVLAGLPLGLIYGLIVAFPVGAVYGLIAGAGLGLAIGSVEGALMALITLATAPRISDFKLYRLVMGLTSLVPAVVLLAGLVVSLAVGSSVSAWTTMEFGALIVAGSASWFVALRVADWAEFEIRTLRERQTA
jgi:hypothetical protein